MQFVAGKINGVLLRNILHDAIDDCTRVRAAVAYASSDNMELFEACRQAGKSLTYYGRYDYTVPVSPEILEWFLVQRSADLVCKLVPDILHAKVIWWEGVGAYIGSANLSGRAWNSNIEVGIYLEQADLESQGQIEQLESFFDTVEEQSTRLTTEIWQHAKATRDLWIKKVSKVEAACRDTFSRSRKIPINEGLTYHSNANAVSKHRANFISEWNSTLQIMRDIGARVSKPENRPDWIEPNTASGLQADQFLHALYYQRVKDGSTFPFDKYFQENKLSRESALADALDWWKNGWKWESKGYVYDDEAAALARAPMMESRLSKSEFPQLTCDEFTEVGKWVYAMRDFAFRQPAPSIGLPPNETNYDVKAEAFARMQYTRTSTQGKSILETIYFVLYGGSDADIAVRIWDAAHEPKWKIVGMGLSTLGEIVGWALPNKFPPRNGRSSKALRALGNDVRVY
ncbi:hypothetical protein OKW30_003715 [Paraburkholderia sp. Clong3]|uniref:phospholipase D family protein n=1 Tax=Paraburkholderia sp. Clong3 TaxID=2991061 RepID=UPI003D246089